jgi:hypothetical protein
MDQSQHLRAIGVHGNDMGFEGSPGQWRDTDVVVCAWLESPGAGFQVGSCWFVLAVHPDRKGALQIFLVWLAESKSDGRQRADDIVFTHSYAPSVASGDPDRLAHDPLLAHCLAGV